jgi:uncharacterized membrane protein
LIAHPSSFEHERKIQMAEMIGPIELIVAAFSDEEKAGVVLKDLKALEKDGVILLVNAAVMVKDDKGKISVKETEDITGGKGALFGAIAGGLIGLLGGPVGVIIGAAAGAATGGVAANKIDMGFPDDMLKELESSLSPGTSAILALIQHQWVDAVVEELEKAGAKLFRQAIKEELASQLAEGEAKTGEEAQPQSKE